MGKCSQLIQIWHFVFLTHPTPDLSIFLKRNIQHNYLTNSTCSIGQQVANKLVMLIISFLESSIEMLVLGNAKEIKFLNYGIFQLGLRSKCLKYQHFFPTLLCHICMSFDLSAQTCGQKYVLIGPCRARSK